MCDQGLSPSRLVVSLYAAAAKASPIVTPTEPLPASVQLSLHAAAAEAPPSRRYNKPLPQRAFPTTTAEGSPLAAKTNASSPMALTGFFPPAATASSNELSLP